jgi:hypothetical protein
MKAHRPVTLAVLCVAALLVTACTPSQAQAPTPDAAATQQAAVQQAVAATVAAQNGANNTPTEPPPAATDTAAPAPPATTPVVATQPTDTPQPTATTAPQGQAQTQNAAPACVVQSGINLRAGPGTVFAPPIAALPNGAQLTPLAFVARGFPSGQWIQVKAANGQIGWVSALQTSVSCNIDPTQLPPGVPPPTPAPPAPAPTATLPPIAQIAEADVVVGGELGDLKGKLVSFGALPGTSDQPVFHDKMALQAIIRDPKAGSKDGAGIKNVVFQIYEGQDTVSDSLVYSHTENTAGFCIFGGGEPTCNLLDLAYTHNWPDTNKPIKQGLYSVQITSNPKNPDRNGAFWHFQFKIQ